MNLRPIKKDTSSLKTMCRSAWSLNEDVVLSVNEIKCADPSCPDVETVIMIMVPNKPTFGVKISKPIEKVVVGDLVEVCEQVQQEL